MNYTIEIILKDENGEVIEKGEAIDSFESAEELLGKIQRRHLRRIEIALKDEAVDGEIENELLNK